MVKEKTREEVVEYTKRIAKKNGWILHPNDDVTFSMLIEGLQANFNRLGYFNCPCRDSYKDRKSDADIICPCRYADPDIKEFGHCYCALYFDSSFNFKKPIKMIPERRPENK